MPSAAWRSRVLSGLRAGAENHLQPVWFEVFRVVVVVSSATFVGGDIPVR